MLVLLSKPQSTARQPLIARLPILIGLMVTLPLPTAITLLVLPQPLLILILMLVLLAKPQSTAQQPLIARLPMLIVLMVTLPLPTAMMLLVMRQHLVLLLFQGKRI